MPHPLCDGGNRDVAFNGTHCEIVAQGVLRQVRDAKFATRRLKAFASVCYLKDKRIRLGFSLAFDVLQQSPHFVGKWHGAMCVILCTPPHEPRFKRDTAGVVYFIHSQLVVTTALILTFSPGEKGQRLQASLYAVVRRANPVACALGFMASMRELFRGILSPEAREIRSPPIRKNLLPGRWNGLRGSKNVQDGTPLLKGEWAREVDVWRSAAIFPKA